MKKITSIIIGLLSSLSVFAQSTYQPMQTETYHIIDRLEIKSGKLSDSVFTTVKPFNRKALQNYSHQISLDTTIELSKTDKELINYIDRDNWMYTGNGFEKSKNPIFKNIYKSKSDFFAVNVPDFSLRFNPVLYNVIGKENDNEKNIYTNTRGVEIEGIISKKLAFYTYVTENQLRAPGYVQNNLDSNFRILAGSGLTKPYSNGTAIDFSEARGYISFSPIRHISVQFGSDRNFIGNGFRSMILSDVGNNNLFLKFNTNVWKLNYTNLFFELTDVNGALNSKTFPKKYAAFHHLSVNLTKNLNIGLFENIVFAGD